MSPKSKHLSSPDNATIKELRKLLAARGIQDQGQALVAGDKVIPEVVSRHADRLVGWLTLEDGVPPPKTVPWYTLTKALFAELDQFGTGGPLAIVDVPTFAEWSDGDAWPKGCTLFVPFQNPENVGAVVRSAVAFGVARFILLKEAAHPFHPRSMRAAGTALLSAAFLRGPSIETLSVRAVPLLALDAGGASLSFATFAPTFALLPGVEGPGLPRGLKATTLSIPMEPGVEALNAATATAIALYEWRRR